MSQEKWAVKGSDSVAAIGRSALFRFFFSSFWLVIRFPAALLAHRLTVQVYAVSIVNRSIHDAVGKARITVLNNVSIGVVSGKRLAELLRSPVRCGMGRDIAMHDLARSDFHKHEYLEKPERRRHHDKEVAGHDARCVIPDEGRPALLRIQCAVRTGCP